MATEARVESGEDVTQPATVLSRMGKTSVGPVGINLLTGYLLSFSGFLLYSLLRFWPLSDGRGPNAGELSFEATPGSGRGGLIRRCWSSRRTCQPCARTSLVLLVCGQSGRALELGLQYILMPFVGATLGVVFYVVVEEDSFHPRQPLRRSVHLASLPWQASLDYSRIRRWRNSNS